eukprot:11890860-Ditylum_brightwellii.AAC.1
MAVQTCTQLSEEYIAIMVLCLTFRGSPGPYKWDSFPSELVTLPTQTSRTKTGIKTPYSHQYSILCPQNG